MSISEQNYRRLRGRLVVEHVALWEQEVDFGVLALFAGPDSQGEYRRSVLRQNDFTSIWTASAWQPYGKEIPTSTYISWRYSAVSSEDIISPQVSRHALVIRENEGEGNIWVRGADWFFIENLVHRQLIVPCLHHCGSHVYHAHPDWKVGEQTHQGTIGPLLVQGIWYGAIESQAETQHVTLYETQESADKHTV